MEVARAVLPASLALVAHMALYSMCGESVQTIPYDPRRCRQVSVVNVDAPLTQHASTLLLKAVHMGQHYFLEVLT